MFELVPFRRHRALIPFGRDIERVFDGFFDRPVRFFDEETAWMPSVDVSETGKEIRVKAELPGMDAKDIEVSLNDGHLTIRGERKQENEEKDENVHRVERRYGSFSRSFRLPVEVDVEKVKADYKDGVLSIHLPKSEENSERKIEIKAA